MRARWLALALLHLYVLAQLLIPLRHWLYPGTVSWTEEGHRFSWHMKLRRKRATMTITVTDPATGRRWQIDPAADLRDAQSKKLYTFPDMMLQYAHYKRDELRASGHPRSDDHRRLALLAERRAAAAAGRSDVNLAAAEDSIWPAPWILPEAARR